MDGFRDANEEDDYRRRREDPQAVWALWWRPKIEAALDRFPASDPHWRFMTQKLFEVLVMATLRPATVEDVCAPDHVLRLPYTAQRALFQRLAACPWAPLAARAQLFADSPDPELRTVLATALHVLVSVESVLRR